MRNICIVLVLIFSVHSAYSQIVGLRVNTEFSENVKINLASCVGGYLILDDFSKPFEAMLSFDFSQKNRVLLNEELESRYKRYEVGISGLFTYSIAEKLYIKVGPSLSYGNLRAVYGELGTSSISTYEAKPLGILLVTDLHFKEVLNSPINLDIFLAHAYYQNTNLQINPRGVDPLYKSKYSIINLRFGISYKIKE